jgi:hypothetical protein
MASLVAALAALVASWLLVRHHPSALQRFCRTSVAVGLAKAPYADRRCDVGVG